MAFSGGPAGGVAAAVIARKRRKILETFREAGALSAAGATPREELGLRKSVIFRRLARTGVLVDCGDERYYLDEEAAARAHRSRLQRAAVILTLVAVGLVVVLILEKL